MECNANACETSADINLRAVATVIADITGATVCSGSILPGESGTDHFKSSIN